MNDKRRKKRLWHAAVILVIAAACLLSVGVGNYLVNYAIAEIRAGYDFHEASRSIASITLRIQVELVSVAVHMAAKR